MTTTSAGINHNRDSVNCGSLDSPNTIYSAPVSELGSTANLNKALDDDIRKKDSEVSLLQPVFCTVIFFVCGPKMPEKKLDGPKFYTSHKFRISWLLHVKVIASRAALKTLGAAGWGTLISADSKSQTPFLMHKFQSGSKNSSHLLHILQSLFSNFCSTSSISSNRQT